MHGQQKAIHTQYHHRKPPSHAHDLQARESHSSLLARAHTTHSRFLTHTHAPSLTPTHTLSNKHTFKHIAPTLAGTFALAHTLASSLTYTDGLSPSHRFAHATLAPTLHHTHTLNHAYGQTHLYTVAHNCKAPRPFHQPRRSDLPLKRHRKRKYARGAAHSGSCSLETARRRTTSRHPACLFPGINHPSQVLVSRSAKLCNTVISNSDKGSESNKTRGCARGGGDDAT